MIDVQREVGRAEADLDGAHRAIERRDAGGGERPRDLHVLDARTEQIDGAARQLAIERGAAEAEPERAAVGAIECRGGEPARRARVASHHRDHHGVALARADAHRAVGDDLAVIATPGAEPCRSEAQGLAMLGAATHCEDARELGVPVTAQLDEAAKPTALDRGLATGQHQLAVRADDQVLAAVSGGQRRRADEWPVPMPAHADPCRATDRPTLALLVRHEPIERERGLDDRDVGDRDLVDAFVGVRGSGCGGGDQEANRAHQIEDAWTASRSHENVQRRDRAHRSLEPGAAPWCGSGLRLPA
ncbi:MAG: hypothetical protein M3619_27605 [Myxococcota bacterium]|nr:hypothetical protein [Myxococcota bacterium]